LGKSAATGIGADAELHTLPCRRAFLLQLATLGKALVQGFERAQTKLGRGAGSTPVAV
jgi:hypothetical protein